MTPPGTATVKQCHSHYDDQKLCLHQIPYSTSAIATTSNAMRTATTAASAATISTTAGSTVTTKITDTNTPTSWNTTAVGASLGPHLIRKPTEATA